MKNKDKGGKKSQHASLRKKKITKIRISPPGSKRFRTIRWPPQSEAEWDLLARWLLWINGRAWRACVCDPGSGDDNGSGSDMDGEE